MEGVEGASFAQPLRELLCGERALETMERALPMLKAPDDILWMSILRALSTAAWEPFLSRFCATKAGVLPHESSWCGCAPSCSR
mmetsp:Transcript_55278/g.145530  ORF Transcript_55278/g.145530 Transcript_55278/m.145530 type:complete len:84 (+) Transcript_55278:110-361(+)